MIHSRIARFGMGLAALVALPAAYFGFGQLSNADAQGGFPPDPPSTYYGSISGASAGDGVTASIGTGANSATCGWGSVISDSGSLVYVVDVITDEQVTGCGDTGRTIRFYIAPAQPGGGGRFATPTVAWQSAGAHQQSLTAGAELPFTLFTPQLSGFVAH